MKYFKYILLLITCLSLSSCLESGLDELPAYDEALVKEVTFEYRWMIKEGSSEKLRVQKMDTQTTIDKDNLTITCTINVPASGDVFTQEIRNKVTLSNLNMYCKISTAATLIPLGDAPVLGKIGDFTKSDMQYQVIAADGKTKKTWKLIIAGFNK